MQFTHVTYLFTAFMHRFMSFYMVQVHVAVSHVAVSLTLTLTLARGVGNGHMGNGHVGGHGFTLCRMSSYGLSTYG